MIICFLIFNPNPSRPIIFFFVRESKIIFLILKSLIICAPRPCEEGTAVRRRRLCTCNGGMRFTTFERIQFQELSVIKSNSKREPFDRDKVSKSIRIATRKRPVGVDAIDNFVSKIIMKIEGLGESEIPTSTIGKFIMEGLQYIDTVAYVRYDSVYKNFKEAKDFEQFVGSLDEKKS